MTAHGEPAPGGELVVLVDESGVAVGSAPKADVHGPGTPLHLAFSCYVFDPDGRFLLTRRAPGKPTWPGVWTNSLCGHPAPGEDIVEALRRRGRQELGVALGEVRLVLPGFRYVATMADGTRENELCPVFTAVTSDAVRPAPEEVEQFEWVDWPAFRSDVLAGRRDVSPWARTQVGELSLDVPGGDRPELWSLLPPAAR